MYNIIKLETFYEKLMWLQYVCGYSSKMLDLSKHFWYLAASVTILGNEHGSKLPWNLHGQHENVVTFDK